MLTIPHCDLLVVGAGPAGTSAARAAASRGVETLLIDAKTRIGEPSHCGEFVPDRLFTEHSLDQACVMNRVEFMETRVVSMDSSTGSLSGTESQEDSMPALGTSETKSAGYIIDRVRFDRDLARAAAREGAVVVCAARLVGSDQSGWMFRHHGHTHTVTPRLVIAADGALSRVASIMGINRLSFVRGIQVEVPLNEGSDRCLIFLDPLFVGGYGWVFPKQTTANVGLGTVMRRDVRPMPLLERFLEKLTAMKIIRPGRLAMSGGLIPISGLRPELVRDKVILCGDAAGLTHPVTGAGIPQAVVSGTLAGNFAADALISGTEAPLLAYQKEIQALYQGVIGHASAKRMLLTKFWQTWDFLQLCQETWIGFKGYRRRVRS